MKIEIRDQLLPYVHALRAECLLPGTCVGVKVDYPHLYVGDHAMELPKASPVRGFTLQQDLEKGRVFVFADHFHLTLTAEDNRIDVRFGSKETAEKSWPYPDLKRAPRTNERLSFGSHKAQDGENALHHLDLKRILPWIYRLGQYRAEETPLVPAFNPYDLSEWEAYFQKEYTSLLMPHHPQDGVLSGLFHTIPSFFLKSQEKECHLLSFCPFESGRITDLATFFGTISLEWRKSQPYRAILRVQSSQRVAFVLPSSIVSFAWRKRGGRKQKHCVAEPFFLEEGNTYFLDHFHALVSSGLEVAIADRRK